jgi:hypothetical protein
MVGVVVVVVLPMEGSRVEEGMEDWRAGKLVWCGVVWCGVAWCQV